MNVSLASSLLELELEADRATSEVDGTIWKTGVGVLDKEFPDELWTGGRVMGVGSTSVESGRTLKNIPSVALEIVVAHLLATCNTTGSRTDDSTRDQPPSPLVFIISPPTPATSTIQRIYSILSTRISKLQSKPPGTGQPPGDAKTLLNQVSLLQYLDLAGLLESLSEVASTLQSRKHRCILFVQGLTSTLKASLRRNGLVQTAALLTSVLQSISSVARSTNSLCLCLVDLDVAWSPSAAQARIPIQIPIQDRGQQHPPGDERTNLPREPSIGGAENVSELQTAFTSKTAKMLRVNAHEVLRELVEKAMDAIVVVHDADGKIEGRGRIVEVVKDERVELDPDGEEDDGQEEEKEAVHGSALGRWVIWE